MGNILPTALQQEYLQHLEQVNQRLQHAVSGPELRNVKLAVRGCRIFPFLVWLITMIWYFTTGPDAGFRIHPLPATLIAVGISWVMWNKILGPSLLRKLHLPFEATKQIDIIELDQWWMKVGRLLAEEERGHLVAEDEIEDVPSGSRALINNDRIMGYVTPFVKDGAVWLVDQDGNLLTRTDISSFDPLA